MLSDALNSSSPKRLINIDFGHLKCQLEVKDATTEWEYRLLQSES